jgi:hypothetical protein
MEQNNNQTELSNFEVKKLASVFDILLKLDKRKQESINSPTINDSS